MPIPKVEVIANPEESAPMSGDYLIPEPEASWDTTVVLSAGIDDVWAGRTGNTRMGPVSEQGTGYLLPARYNRVIGKKYRSAAPDSPLPRQLQVGDSLPDGHHDDRLFVRELTDGGSLRTMVLEATWPASKKRSRPMHYTWQVAVSNGTRPGETVLTTRTRMEGLKKPESVRKHAEKLDRFALRVMGKGIIEGL